MRIMGLHLVRVGRVVRTSGDSRAVEMFAALMAEIRAYGEGLVIAEQIPAKLIPDVIKNSAVKIVHRLPAKDDREVVGATMNLSEGQSEFLVTVPPGVAGVFSDGMDNPILTAMPDGTTVEARDGARTAGSPERFVLPSFGRCAAEYGPGPVTVGCHVRGRNLVEAEPVLRWWAELAVVAHLVGMPMPILAGQGLQSLRASASDVAGQVIVAAVDDAVAARSGLVVDRMAPAGLAAHVAGALLAQQGGMDGCRSRGLLLANVTNEQ